jgi:hypothetical protein
MSDAATTALISGAAGVLGALVGGMSSYFLQKSTNLEKQVEERAAAFVGFLTAARQLITLLPAGEPGSSEGTWREFESRYLEVQLYAVNYVAESAREFRAALLDAFSTAAPQPSLEQREALDQGWNQIASRMRVAIRYSRYSWAKRGWLAFRVGLGHPSRWE